MSLRKQCVTFSGRGKVAERVMISERAVMYIYNVALHYRRCCLFLLYAKLNDGEVLIAFTPTPRPPVLHSDTPQSINTYIFFFLLYFRGFFLFLLFIFTRKNMKKVAELNFINNLMARRRFLPTSFYSFYGDQSFR